MGNVWKEKDTKEVFDTITILSLCYHYAIDLLVIIVVYEFRISIG